MPIQEDYNNNTPSELGGFTQGNNPDAPSNLDRAAKQLADAIGVSPEEARGLITAYADQAGVDYHQAAVAIAHNGPGIVQNPPQAPGGGEAPSGGSPSTTGGSTGSSGPSPQQLRNAEASYISILTGWGIPIKPAVQTLVAQAARAGVSTTAFVLNFRKTKAYAKRFPGIVRPNGTMRMTEAQYLSGYLATKDAAAKLGRSFSLQAYGAAIKNGQSVAEISDRLEVVDKIKSYGPQLAEFSDYLLSTGQIKKPLTRKDAQDFIMGYRGDLQAAWTEANTAFKLQEQANVNVGKPGAGNDISYKELKGMLGRYQALGGDPEQVDFVKMGALISEVLPKNELYGAGITKKDIVNMMLSGKNAGEVTKRVQNVLDTYEAAVSEPAAHVQGYAGRAPLGTPAASSE